MSSVQWQCCKVNLRERATYMYKNRLQTDCIIFVNAENGEQVRFEAHKIFLSMTSPVFERMFESDCKERDESVILIEDIRPEVFEKMIEYIYMDRFTVTHVEQAKELYQAADKYMMPQLGTQCLQYISKNVNVNNVCRVYEFARFFEIHGMELCCIELIKKHTSAVIINKTFLDVQYSTLLKIFAQDSLNIYSESELFDALARYALKYGLRRKNIAASEQTDETHSLASLMSEDSCLAADEERCNNSEEMLLMALRQIRFLNFNPREFARSAARSSLLSADEKLAIFLNICDPVNQNAPLPQGFSRLRTNRSNLTQQETENVFQSRAMIRTLNHAYHGQCQECFVNATISPLVQALRSERYDILQPSSNFEFRSSESDDDHIAL